MFLFLFQNKKQIIIYNQFLNISAWLYHCCFVSQIQILWNSWEKMLTRNGLANSPWQPPPSRQHPIQLNYTWQERDVLRKEQLRLLHLQHATTCPHTSSCLVPSCRDIKELWSHVLTCKEQNCRFPDCLSSRKTLLHWYGCQDNLCQFCESVRCATRTAEQRGVPAYTVLSAFPSAVSGEERPTATQAPQLDQQAHSRPNLDLRNSGVELMWVTNALAL